MSNAETTLEVLANLRRRWAEYFSDEAARHEMILQQARPDVGGPFAGNANLAELAGQLAELQTLIAAFEQATKSTLPLPRDDSRPRQIRTVDSISPFSVFVSFVMDNRLVEATQELSRILPMPVDQLATATDRFARAVHGNPRLADQLEGLCRNLDTLSDPDAARILIQTLGFQVIEAQIAVDTLRRAVPSTPGAWMAARTDAFTAKRRLHPTSTQTNKAATAGKS